MIPNSKTFERNLFKLVPNTCTNYTLHIIHLSWGGVQNLDKLAMINIYNVNAQIYLDGDSYTLNLFTMLDKLIMIYIWSGNAQTYCKLVDGDSCTLNLLTMLQSFFLHHIFKKRVQTSQLQDHFHFI
jgi:hypothetical protein